MLMAEPCWNQHHWQSECKTLPWDLGWWQNRAGREGAEVEVRFLAAPVPLCVPSQGLSDVSC